MSGAKLEEADIVTKLFESCQPQQSDYTEQISSVEGDESDMETSSDCLADDLNLLNDQLASALDAMKMQVCWTGEHSNDDPIHNLFSCLAHQLQSDWETILNNTKAFIVKHHYLPVVFQRSFILCIGE